MEYPSFITLFQHGDGRSSVRRPRRRLKMTKLKNEITAEEAIVLAGPTPEERIGPVLAEIREAATKGARNIHLHDWWANMAYRPQIDGRNDPATQKNKRDYAECLKLLAERGFKTDFYYAEHQFVDMYLIVSW